MMRLVCVVVVPIVVLLGVMVQGQQPPEQTLASLKPAAGLELKLWASEPMVANRWWRTRRTSPSTS